MAIDSIVQRIRAAVRKGGDYLVPVDRFDPGRRAAATEVLRVLADEGGEAARHCVERLAASGELDPVTRLSALQVIAASPSVGDLAEASRLADQQELLALELGGAELEANLAAVDRHRGVVAFRMGHSDIALDWFTRAFERERSPENLGNVLASLLAAGDRLEAVELLAGVLARFPQAFCEGLLEQIRADGDLAALRSATRS